MALKTINLLLACIFLAAGSAMAQGAAPVEQDGRVVCLTEHLAFARDPSGNAGIADRHALAWFKADCSAAQEPAFGYTSDAIWARVDVGNVSGDPIDAVLELSLARLTQATWFVFDGDRLVRQASSGLRAAGGDALPQTRYPFIDVVLPAGAVRTVYLRIRSNTAIWVPLQLSSLSGYVRYAARRDFASHAFAGVGLAILLLSLLNAWVQRNRHFLLLAAIVGCFTGYYLIFHGYYVWLGGPLQGWVNRQLMIGFALLAHWAFLRFTLDCASGDLRGGRLLAWANRLIWCLPVGGLFVFAMPFRQAVNVLLALLALCHVLGPAVAFRSVWQVRSMASWLLASVWGAIYLVVFLLSASSFNWFAVPFDIMAMQRTFMLLVFLVFFAIVTIQQRSVRQEAERAQRAEQLSTEAQLRALRYQLNPHFLFNTLTSIDALSRKAPERIAALVRKLAVYLRLQLKPSSDGMSVFENEWASLKAYLDIEQVRFSDSLRVRYEVQDDVLKCRMPEMLLQPLAENAIKHGSQANGVADVCFRAWRTGSNLHVRVENSGCLKRNDNSASHGGVGLRNVKERLMRLYGEAARFDLWEEDKNVVAEIAMPFEEAKA